MLVVGWSEVPLYSWFESGGIFVSMLVCERGFGFDEDI